MEDTVKIREIKRYGSDVRKGYYEILHNCWYINRDIRDRIQRYKNFGWDVIDVVGCQISDEQAQESMEHWVLVIDTDVVEEINTSGYIVVDGALDQFNDKNFEMECVPFSYGKKGRIPGVGVYEPGNPRLKKCYHDRLSVDDDKYFKPNLPI